MAPKCGSLPRDAGDLVGLHSQGRSEHKPIKSFGEQEAWAYPGTAQIFWVPPIISGTGKATDFKFCGNIHRVDPNTSPLKALEKRKRGRIQGLPNFFEYPLLSQERVKLRTSNFVGTFTGSIRTQALSGVPKIFRAPM